MADDSIPTRVAVLEQIARETATTLTAIRDEIHDMRSDLRDIRQDQRSDFRWLFSLMLGGIAITIGGFVSLLIAVLRHTAGG